MDFEYDQAYFTLGLTESTQDERGEWVTEVSHEQSPMIFKGNNDHFKTVRRELIAEDVQAAGQTRRHTLTLASRTWMRQRTGLPLLEQSKGSGTESCLYVAVKIHVRAAAHAGQGEYSQDSGHVRQPQLIATRPEESPVFLHGRPGEARFEAVFNTRPYLNHHTPEEKADENAIREALRLKATTVTVPGGQRSEVLLEPVQVTCSSKEYEGEEYHVAVAFDLGRFENTATEKLVHAQFVVLTAILVDAGNRPFEVAEGLGHRGLPIYVFEATDQEELLHEEADTNRAAAGTEAGEEAEKRARDVSIEKSDLERAVEPEQPQAQAVQCQCVHGKCREGESHCTGPCDAGWSGTYCSTPSDSETYKHARGRARKDFTRDGLYRPQAIADQTSSGWSPKSRGESGANEGSRTRAKRIEGDEPSSQSSIPSSISLDQQSTALREQISHVGELPAGATADASNSEATSAGN